MSCAAAHIILLSGLILYFVPDISSSYLIFCPKSALTTVKVDQIELNLINFYGGEGTFSTVFGPP